MRAAAGVRATATKPERAGLALLAGFTLIALAGYAVFALRPGNLALVPFAAGFFGVSFRVFAQLHIVVSFLALATILVTRTGLRWIPALVATSLLSFAAEHTGTGYGIPFGGYEYTALLGLRIGPRVPALIPLSWFLMALPSWVIARHAFPESRVARVLLGAVVLVLWDLALDPAMSALTSYWVWHESGPYYGMPWMNLAGWLTTGLVLMSALEFLGRDGAFDPLPPSLMLAFWGLVLLMPLGMLVAAASWLAVTTTTVGIGLTAFSVLLLRSAGVGAAGLDPRSAAVSAPGSAPGSDPGSATAPSPAGAP